MTTLAYRDGVLASESLVSSGSQRAGFMQKSRRIGDLLYASCGSAGLTDRLESWLRSGAKGPPPSLKEGDATGSVFVFMPDDMIVWFHADGQSAMRAPFWASGSGGPYALGAMSMGATAEQAVRAAIEHDTASGGEVTVIRRPA